MALWGIGTVGGLCPDLDSKNSMSQCIVFILCCGLFCLSLGSQLPAVMPLPMAIVTILGSMALLYHQILPRLCAFMNHRGNCHSLLTAVLASLTITNIAAYLLGRGIESAYLIGLFFFGGFLSHLVLDEIYAIDLKHRKLKKSFGTAIKPFSMTAPFSTLMLGALCWLQFWITPSTSSLKMVLSKLTKATLMTLG